MNRFEFYSSVESFKEKNSLQHHGIKGQRWGIRRYQNEDGSLTEEGKARYLNPDGSLNDKAPIKVKSAYNRYQWQKQQQDAASGKLYEDDYVYDKNKQAEKLEHAKTSKKFDVTFLDATQNADDMTDDEAVSEYEKYLKNPYKYAKEFDPNNWRKDQTKNKSTESSKKEKTNNDESEYKKELNKRLDKKGYIDVDDLNEMKNLSTKKPGESQSTKGSSKPSKEEKKAIKEAKKETTKLLQGGGMINNWNVLNKAMDELGFTSAERKNLSSSDWKAINEKIQDIRENK